MEDRELLALAAKSAGYTLYPEWDCAAHGIFLGRGCGDDPQKVWNPLTDDGDALRLAVKLQIDIRHFLDAVRSGFDETDLDGFFVAEKHIDESTVADPYAATRRAIVRAAAEIGRQNG